MQLELIFCIFGNLFLESRTHCIPIYTEKKQYKLGNIHFFKGKIFMGKWVSKTKINLKKMLTKFPATNALAAILENADFT